MRYRSDSERNYDPTLVPTAACGRRDHRDGGPMLSRKCLQFSSSLDLKVNCTFADGHVKNTPLRDECDPA